MSKTRITIRLDMPTDEVDPDALASLIRQLGTQRVTGGLDDFEIDVTPLGDEPPVALADQGL